jgi:hypothetical protein
MRSARPRLGVAAVCLLALLALAPAASAHQSTSSDGVTVTMHIAPDDEPVAGQPATLVLVSAKRRGWRRGDAAVRLRVTDATGRAVLDRRVRTRATFTFPRSGAYRVTWSGRLHKGSRTRPFSAAFTYRAD